MKKLIIATLSLMLIITAFTGCVEEIATSDTSSNTSSQITSQEQSSDITIESSQPELIEKETQEIKDLSGYRRIGINETPTGTYDVYATTCYDLIEQQSKPQLNKIVGLLADLTGLYNIYPYNSTPKDKVELGGHILFIAGGEGRKNVIEDTEPLAKEWDVKFPKTKTYLGTQNGGYLEKKFVDQSINKYFCSDRENISFDGIKESYCPEGEFYSLLPTGREDETLPVIWSYEEDDKKVECIFSLVNFLYVNSAELYARDPVIKDNVVIGGFEVFPANTPKGKAQLAKQKISEEYMPKLNKIKFIFCKQPDGSLKIHSVEYL